jgi:TetR/AcrR family transcriptional regulator, cholesterol catabolism regulator
MDSDNPIPRRKKRSNKKGFIYEQATLLFMARGYHGTTMDHVAAATKLNKGTLYFYYKSKADILFEILDMVATRIIGRAMIDPNWTTPIEGISALVKMIILTIYELQPQSAVYFKEMPWVDTILDEAQVATLRMKEKAFYDQCQRVFSRALESGVVRSMTFADFFHSLMGLTSFAHRWIKKSSSPDDVAARVANMILYGVAAVPALKGNGEVRESESTKKVTRARRAPVPTGPDKPK